jgi:hypothetical protein
MLNKQQIQVNFAQGVNTKPDPFQLPIGQFLALENSVFDKGGLLQKRNGFGQLTTLPTVANYLTTLNDSLIGINDTVNALDAGNNTWVQQGFFQQCGVSTLPLIRNNVNQTQVDTTVSLNGLVCTVYTEVVAGTPSYKLAIANSTTGQNIVAPQDIPVASGSVAGSPRVFLLGNYFVIVVDNLITATHFLQYIAIPVFNPTTITGALNYTTAQVTSSAYTPASTVAWDGVVANNGTQLFIAFNSLAGGQSIKVTFLTPQNVAAAQSGASPTVFAGSIATMVSVCVDSTILSSLIIFISFYDSASQTGFTCSVNTSLAPLIGTPEALITSTAISSITSVAQNNICSVFFEVVVAYSYDSGIPTHRLILINVTNGTAGSIFPVARGVGLASKAFLFNGVAYVLAAYQSPFQPTYFLLNVPGTSDEPVQVVAKLAYENGGGYLALGLPSVSLVNGVYQVGYLYKDLVEALTTTNTTSQTTAGGVYSQTGINLASFDLAGAIDSAEIANNLHIGGGFLWSYDGYTPVEHNFFLWPDSVEVTGHTTGGLLTAQPYFYQVTYEWSDNAGNVYRSAPSIPVTVTTTGSTSSVTVNVPLLRLTYKIANPVKIVIYRWSEANQVYHQVTSITSPVLNLNTTFADSVAFVDTLADDSIQGNNIIYTTGGVVEDVNAPASSIVSLFDTRLWLVDAEDPNLLWFSKQVIESTPVEMSDLFTFYVAPTIGSQGSSGPMTALAPMDDKLVVFKKNAIYYINGTGPDNTGANNQYSQPIFVTSTVGCVNQQSIVFMPNGLMFQSDKGIWLLDRSITTTYIGAPVQSFTLNATVLSALNIPATNQVRFTMSTGITLVYDYFYGQWSTFVGVPGTASCLYQSLHTFVDSFGRVFQETPGTYLDGATPVTLSLTTSWISTAALQGFQRAYYFYLLGVYYSPHILDVGIAYNFEPSIAHNSLIYPDNYSSATPSAFGDQPAPFGSPTPIEQWRVFFKQQKCQSFQITIKEVYDPSFGVPAGAGLTLSGINLTVAAKRGVRPIAARKSVG